MLPGQCSLHNPSRLTQLATMICVAAGQGRCNAAFPQGLAMWQGIVGPVPLDPFGTLTRTTALAANRWNRLDQSQKLGDVVRISAGQRGCHGNARRIRKEVKLAARLAAIVGFGPVFAPPSTARTLALSTRARDHRSGRRLADDPTASRATCPTNRPRANPLVVASKSSRNHPQFLW